MSVQARDEEGLLSSVSTVTVALGNDPPEPAITSPAEGDRFATGQTVTLRGSATDTEDGSIPGGSLTWEVTLHHDTHTHPFLASTAGAQVTFTAPAPESLGAVQTS